MDTKQQAIKVLARDWGASARYPMHVSGQVAFRMVEALDAAGLLADEQVVSDRDEAQMEFADCVRETQRLREALLEARSTYAPLGSELRRFLTNVLK